MTVKEHYDKHLANFYAWMLGDFEEAKNLFIRWCEQHQIKPLASNIAIDLGAGNGVQSVALAEIGYKVKAIDFNRQLLAELDARRNGLPIEMILDDLKNVSNYKEDKPELIVCCGDTISHLANAKEIAHLIGDAFNVLSSNGKLILSFRDYSNTLQDIHRFIPVKSDSNRILTCFLEYFSDKVKVTDILHEKGNDKWHQKTSSYEKVRVSQDLIVHLLIESGFAIDFQEVNKGMVTVLARSVNKR